MHTHAKQSTTQRDVQSCMRCTIKSSVKYTWDAGCIRSRQALRRTLRKGFALLSRVGLASVGALGARGKKRGLVGNRGQRYKAELRGLDGRVHHRDLVGGGDVRHVANDLGDVDDLALNFFQQLLFSNICACILKLTSSYLTRDASWRCHGWVRVLYLFFVSFGVIS